MQEHERWLAIAQEDLLAAKSLTQLELFSSSVYHCQQSAEKALKAYLAFTGHQIYKTHDLIKLLELCMIYDNEFSKKFEAVDFINPFATRFRYPTEFEIPNKSESEIALKHASSILKFVLSKISTTEPGQKNIF